MDVMLVKMNVSKMVFALTALSLSICSSVAYGDSGHGASAETNTSQNTGLYENTGEGDFTPPKPGTYRLPPIKSAGDGNVLDHEGRPASLKKLMAGRISIVSFIYTTCDDVKGCPMATAKLFDLHDASMADPEIANNARLISLSFNPKHDTPKVMKSYGYGAIADEDAAKKMPWSFLTTKSTAEINPILAQYGQVIDQRGTGSAISHLLRVYLVDRAGQIRNIYGLGFLDQRLLVGDIKTLLMEEAALAKNAVQ